jgi:hypothetical protein
MSYFPRLVQRARNGINGLPCQMAQVAGLRSPRQPVIPDTIKFGESSMYHYYQLLQNTKFRKGTRRKPEKIDYDELDLERARYVTTRRFYNGYKYTPKWASRRDEHSDSDYSVSDDSDDDDDEEYDSDEVDGDDDGEERGLTDGEEVRSPSSYFRTPFDRKMLTRYGLNVVSVLSKQGEGEHEGSDSEFTGGDSENEDGSGSGSEAEGEYDSEFDSDDYETDIEEGDSEPEKPEEVPEKKRQ